MINLNPAISAATLDAAYKRLGALLDFNESLTNLIAEIHFEEGLKDRPIHELARTLESQNCQQIATLEAEIRGMEEGGQPLVATSQAKTPNHQPAISTDHLRALERFLGDIEHRAFRKAGKALKSEDEAREAVQDSMERLVRRYSDRPEDEWPPLFYRILQSRINDTFRRRNTRDRYNGTLGWGFDGEEERGDPFQQVAAPETSDPAVTLERRQKIGAIYEAAESLTEQQRRALTLRAWEGLSTEETAIVMRCSEGTVKTHYARALRAMKTQLEACG